LSSNSNANAGQAFGKAHSRFFSVARVHLPVLWPVVLFAGLFNVFASETACAQPGNDEYHIKAAFLFHFAQLVEWPPDAFNGRDNSLSLCILEDDALYDELENSVEGKKIGSRAVHIRHIHLSQAAHGCNMIFISRNEGKSLPWPALRNQPVLTTGDADDFLKSGGMIRLHVDSGKIRFDINLAAAEAAHLNISSRLLLLATSVTRGGEPNERRVKP
jgi:hypothetical protein